MTAPAFPRAIGGARRIAHPDPMRVGDYEIVLIVDELANPIWDGDTVLGWQGDPQLALYVNVTWGRWELWRLEDDGQYRMTTWWSMDHVRGGEIVGRCILFCLRNDAQRNPLRDLDADVRAANYKAHQPVRDKSADLMAEAVDRVKFGLRKDKA